MNGLSVRVGVDQVDKNNICRASTQGRCTISLTYKTLKDIHTQNNIIITIIGAKSSFSRPAVIKVADQLEFLLSATRGGS